MTTGQTLITILALALLSLAVLNVNRGLSSHDVSLAQNRYRLEALSIATSYIEQASQYYFDEAVENVKWPVFASLIAISAVSLSLISPTITTSGS